MKKNRLPTDEELQSWYDTLHWGAWAEVPGHPITCGDVGEYQVSEAWSRRWALKRSDNKWAIVDDQWFVARLKKSGQLDMVNSTEFTICTNPLDPGGTEEWADIIWRTVPTLQLTSRGAETRCGEADPFAIYSWSGEDTNPLKRELMDADAMKLMAKIMESNADQLNSVTNSIIDNLQKENKELKATLNLIRLTIEGRLREDTMPTPTAIARLLYPNQGQIEHWAEVMEEKQ